jgi:hypothetical protein
MKHIAVSIALALTMFWGSTCQASLLLARITYHVSPQGCDTNPGTQELPFATIQKAVDVASHRANDADVRKVVINGETVEADDVAIGVHLEEGTYFITEPIRINAPVLR